MATNTISCDVVELHYKDASTNSDKYYRTYTFGRTVHVQFGRRGTEGQWQTKAFPSEYSAQDFAVKQLRSKTSKGYRQTRSARFDAPATASIAELQRMFLTNAKGTAPNDPTPNETLKATRAKEEEEAEKFRQQLLKMRQGLDAKADGPDAPAPAPESLESKLAAALANAKAKS